MHRNDARRAAHDTHEYPKLIPSGFQIEPNGISNRAQTYPNGPAIELSRVKVYLTCISSETWLLELGTGFPLITWLAAGRLLIHLNVRSETSK